MHKNAYIDEQWLNVDMKEIFLNHGSSYAMKKT